MFKTLNSIILVGILRGGGAFARHETRNGLCWLIGVPLALLAAAVWHFPVQLVVICAGAVKSYVKPLLDYEESFLENGFTD